jgi:ribulose kinase
LIQTRKNQINESIGNLRENLNEIQNNPVKVEDSEFDGKVEEVKSVVSELHSKAAQKLGN